MTQYLWNHPIIFLIVLTGGYFLARSKKVFSQNLHNDTDLDFLINRCEKSVQREMLSGLLRQFPEHVCFLSLAMLRAAISAGGAGALFWFAVFSLLLKGAQGGISALHHYYFCLGEPDGGAAMATEAALRRKNLGGVKGATWMLLGLQTALLLMSLHPFVLGHDALGWMPDAFWAGVCLLAGLAALACAKKLPWFTDAALPSLFLVFLLAALLYNVGNLTLALRIILADAIQLNRYVFRYSGMGAMRAMAAGAWLCAGSFLLQAYSPYQAKGVEFPHPVFYSVYAQLRCSLMTAVQLLTGILILCFELEPAGNAAVRWMLLGFLCFFSLRRLERVLACLRGSLRRSAAVVLITGSALALCLGFPPSAQTYFGVLSIVLAFGLAAVIIGALSDSGWYFALMEDYRDRYVWHIHPHPDLMFSSKDE